MIVTVRTTTGRENVVLESLVIRANKRKSQVKSIFHTEDLRGYVFVEGEPDEVEKLVKGMPHVRGIVARNVQLAELEKFLVPEKREIKLEVGDIIEVVGGPFKGEKGKITRVDEVKGDVTMELLEAAIPMPVTLPAASVRIHEKKKTQM